MTKIDTVEELLALPAGSAVIADHPIGCDPMRVASFDGRSWWVPGWDFEVEPSSIVPATVAAPAVDPTDEALMERAAQAIHDSLTPSLPFATLDERYRGNARRAARAVLAEVAK